MTFKDEINKQASERIDYVRIEPRRYISDGFVLDSGDIYRHDDFSLIPNAVFINSTELTRVFNLVDLTVNNLWFFDEQTEKLYIRSTDNPLDADNYCNVDYLLFFTDGFHRELNEDPNDSGSVLRLWNPTLTNSPSNSQSIKNVLNGKLSISGTTVNLDNTDDEIYKYFSNDDSFKDKKIVLWVEINGELLETYNGKISNLTFSNDQVSLSVYDAFSGLRNKAFMGDSSAEAYTLKEAGSYPNVDPNNQGKPIPYIINRSRYGWKNNVGVERYTGGISPALDDCFTLDTDRCNQGICIDFGSQTPTNTANRDWVACRTNELKTADIVQGFSTLGMAGGVPAPYYGYRSSTHAVLTMVFSTGSHKLEVGDSFMITRSVAPYNGSPTYCLVTNVFGSTVLAMASGIAPPASFQNLNDGNTSFFTLDAPAVVIKQGSDLFFPLIIQDYQVSNVVTSGGNKSYTINFHNNFESNHSGLNGLNPSEHQIYYRATEKIQVTEYMRHNEVVKKLVETSGLEINTASFDQAWTDLNANCQFQIPFYNENEYGSNLDYVQKILESTLAYISIGTNFKVDYTLFANPVGTETTDENEKLVKADSIRVSYEDIVTELIASNDHAYYTESDQTSFPSSTTLSNDKAKYLHGIVKTKLMDHLLDDISARLPFILALRSNRTANYKYSVETKDWDKKLGDDITLVTSRLLGNDTSKDMKIIGLKKSTKAVTVELTDLEGLT